MDFSIEEKRDLVLKLVLNCPFQNSLSTCPAKALREVSLNDKTSIVKYLTDKILDEIILHHEKCMESRGSNTAN